MPRGLPTAIAFGRVKPSWRLVLCVRASLLPITLLAGTCRAEQRRIAVRYGVSTLST